MQETRPMKRIYILIPVGLAAAALFGALVHAVLVATGLSEPAATTVYGPTTQRMWATSVALLALVGMAVGGGSLFRAARQIGSGKGKRGAIVALIMGFIAVVSGGLLLSIANGGPGTGNGVVGAAMALVLGLIDIALGGLVLSRSRRSAVPAGAK